MKGPVATPTSQARTERSDAAGDHELSQPRLFDPVFAPSHSALLKVISDEVAKLQLFLSDPTAAHMKHALDGAIALRGLMTNRDASSLDVGREAFRKKFAVTILEEVVSLAVSEENTAIVKGILTEDYTGVSSTLCETLTAGISDYNTRLRSILRRSHSADGGSCDTLACQLREVATAIEEMKVEYGRATSEKSNGPVLGRALLERLRPIVAQARELFELIPQERAVVRSFETHWGTSEQRLTDFHLPDAAKAVITMAGDMIECKNALRMVEGIAPKTARGRPSRRTNLAA